MLVPWLAGWDWEAIDPEVRKSFEVALHAGAAAALLIGQRRVIRDELREFDARRALLLALSFLPAAIVGYTLERPIEQRLGGPRAIASGLLAGAAAMLAADTRPQERGPRRRHRRRRARARSRPGRGAGAGRLPQRDHPHRGPLRGGFTRDQANLLSRTVALPVIVGATALKGIRLRRRGAAPELRRSLAIGVGASFASTLASQRLIGLVERDRALWPYAAYRLALAAAVLVRMSGGSMSDAYAKAGVSQGAPTPRSRRWSRA